MGVSRPGFPFPGCAGTGGWMGVGKPGFGAQAPFGVSGWALGGSGHAPAERTPGEDPWLRAGPGALLPSPISPPRAASRKLGLFQNLPHGLAQAQWFCRYCLTGEELSPGS